MNAHLIQKKQNNPTSVVSVAKCRNTTTYSTDIYKAACKPGLLEHDTTTELRRVASFATAVAIAFLYIQVKWISHGEQSSEWSRPVTIASEREYECPWNRFMFRNIFNRYIILKWYRIVDMLFNIVYNAIYTDICYWSNSNSLKSVCFFSFNTSVSNISFFFPLLCDRSFWTSILFIYYYIMYLLSLVFVFW